jgi:hypothetical protein
VIEAFGTVLLIRAAYAEATAATSLRQDHGLPAVALAKAGGG